MDLTTAPVSAIAKRIRSLEKRKSVLNRELERLKVALGMQQDDLLGGMCYTLHELRETNLLQAIKNLRNATFGMMSLYSAKGMVEDVRDGRSPVLETLHPLGPYEAELLSETFMMTRGVR